jgi:diguanylate cyclase (GGDEF)-like protein
MSTVMIADGDADNVSVLSDILKSEYTLLTTGTASEMFELAVNIHPALILLGRLPDADGREALMRLRAIDATRHIPIILVTDGGNLDSEVSFLFLGASDLIIKPFRRELVRARVFAHVRNAKYIFELERLSMIDALTDIPNRRSFDLNMSDEWRRMYRNRSPIGLLMIDVDHFKNYNDTYGHQQGDFLLRRLARVFVSCLRRPSDAVARIGGEEFAVMLPNTDLVGAIGVAENIRASVEAMKVPCADGSRDTGVTVSIGVASVTPGDNHSIGALLELADRNLYAAKTGGRNRIFA